MNKILLAGAAALLLTPIMANAQDRAPREQRPQSQPGQDHGHQGGNPNAGRPDRGAQRAAPSRQSAPPARAPQTDRAMQTPNLARPQNRAPMAQIHSAQHGFNARQTDRQDQPRETQLRQTQRRQPSSLAPDFRGDGGRGGNVSGRFQRQHAAPFRYPQGYGYRHWSSGLFLPSIFLGSSYYYDGYSAFGEGAPPFGYRWIRYGSDLLLVNIRTGRIRRVIYGAFY